MEGFKPISEMSERELIQVILRMYTDDETAVRSIGKHISEKLVHRRTLIRRKRAGIYTGGTTANQRTGIGFQP